MKSLYTHEFLPPVQGYDLIGDVHGCAKTLERLLQKLGYSKKKGVYQHPQRRVIFLGDIIDRGPHIREALLLVFAMVQAGSAHMIMGNHEYNAITYCTKTSNNLGAVEYLRPHTSANTRLISETLEQFANYDEDWKALLQWLWRLPLFMEFGEATTGNAFRVVHACWDHESVNVHKNDFGSGQFTEEFIVRSAQLKTPEANTIQLLTRGVVFPLPDGVKVVTPDGYERKTFRTKFWEHEAQTYGELLFQPDPIPEHIASLPISKIHRTQMVRYGADQPPLFVGHYWLKGQPKPITHNVACLDYSAVKYGRLVAYRMDGEQQLQPKKFVWEYVDP